MMNFDTTVLKDLGLQHIARKETIAVAESVTAGALQLALSTIADASKFFQGGITAYNAAQKFHHLKVEPIHAVEVNCISQQVADQMALEVSNFFRSDWGLAITGYSAPSPEGKDKVFAFFAVSYRGGIQGSGKIEPSTPNGLETQIYYANKLASQLLDLLKSR